MSYKNEKIKLVNEIIKLLGQTKDLEKIIDIRDMLKKEPVLISEFIIDLFNNSYTEDIYKTDDIIYAFEHEIRKISYELGYDGSSEQIFKEIVPSSQYIDHYCELNVDGMELYLWISEGNDSPFDPQDLAWVIYNIYCGKVVFSK